MKKKRIRKTAPRPLLKVARDESQNFELYKQVGARVPPLVFEKLAIYSLANSLSKTKILTNLITDWCNLNVNEDVLIEKLIKKCLNTWKIKKARDNSYELRPFKEAIIHELEWKGLSEENIKKILIGINNGTK